MQREIAQDQKLCINPYGNQVSYVSRLSRKESADGSGAYEKTFSFHTKVFQYYPIGEE